MKKGKLPDPCSSYAIHADTGERIFCSQGANGHDGVTCVGDVSEEAYIKMGGDVIPHRATITIEWFPSASIGEFTAVRTYLERLTEATLQDITSWGVVMPSAGIEFGEGER